MSSIGGSQIIFYGLSQTYSVFIYNSGGLLQFGIYKDRQGAIEAFEP
jgi:hypothetical protein